MRPLLLATIGFFAAAPAQAQTQSLRSFAYQSSGCTVVDGAALLTFGNDTQYKAGPAFAAPGAGIFPESDFHIRALTMTYFRAARSTWRWPWSATPPPAWAEVGRFNSIDDDGWVSPVVPPGQPTTINFAADAAPIFRRNGAAFFDAHVDSCRKGYVLMFAVWYLPVTAKSMPP